MRTQLFLGCLFTALTSACGGGNMPVGIEVVGNHGSVVVDSETANLSFLAKGTVTVAGPNAGTNITFPGATNPIICFRSDNAVILRDFSIASGVVTATLVSTPGSTVHWYAFDVPTFVASSQGLQLFNASGVLTFDSSIMPMVLESVTQVSDASGLTFPPPVASVSAPSSVYAACLAKPRVSYQNNAGIQTLVFMDGVRTTATGAVTESVRAFVIPNGGIATGYTQPKGGQLLLVDVSLIP